MPDDGRDETTEIALLTAALLACIARDLQKAPEQIRVMAALGVSSQTIAKAMGLNPVSVRTALHRLRWHPAKKLRATRARS